MGLSAIGPELENEDQNLTLNTGVTQTKLHPIYDSQTSG